MKKTALYIGLISVPVIGTALSYGWLTKRFHHASASANMQQELSPPESGPEPADEPTASHPVSGVTGEAAVKDREAAVRRIEAAFNTPITFYGRVVDEVGQPVPDASVNYGTLDKFDAPGSHYESRSDNDGKLFITGIHGMVLRVGVRKEGYYAIDGKSHGSFAYGTALDPNLRPPPSKDEPAVFVLRKMGITEPLKPISSRVYRVPKNGTPVRVDLVTGLVSRTGDLQVEAWTEDDVKDARRHYNWHCRISIVGGGLIERSDQFDFQAPTEGYKSSDEIWMSSNAERWHPQVQRHYFAKLSRGRFARLDFTMMAAGDHLFRLESYLNPKPGSRNLEFDPKKVAK